MKCVICAESYGELFITNLSVYRYGRMTHVYAHQDCMDEWNKNNPDTPVINVQDQQVDSEADPIQPDDPHWKPQDELRN